MVKLLKDASIPTAAIIDIDILNSEADLSNAIFAFDSGFDLDEILSLRAEIASNIEGTSEENIALELKNNVIELLAQLGNNEHSLSGARGALNRIRAESTKWSGLKKEGIASLEGEFQAKAQRIIEESLRVGLYIVPVGELEGWMNLGVRKNRWALPALEEIHKGKCPESLKSFVGDIINGI